MRTTLTADEIIRMIQNTVQSTVASALQLEELRDNSSNDYCKNDYNELAEKYRFAAGVLGNLLNDISAVQVYQ